MAVAVEQIFLGWEALVGKELRVAIDKEWGICHQPSYLSWVL